MSETLVRLHKEPVMHALLNACLGEEDFKALQTELLRNADRILRPEGVLMVFTRAIDAQMKEFGNFDDPYSIFLSLKAEDILEAIVDDSTPVIAVWREMLAAMKAEEKPVAVAKANMSYKLFEAVHIVANIIQASAKEAGWDTFGDRRDDSVNPYYDQTTQGLIVEFYYGHPSSIHTPLGKCDITGGGSGYREQGDRFTQLFLNHQDLELELLEPKRVTSMGEFGPWYAIRRVGSLELPHPAKRRNKEYVPYEEAKELWEQLTLAYLARHARQRGYMVHVKKYPSSDSAKKFAGQYVLVQKVHSNGTATILPSNVFATRGGTGARVPLTDLYIFQDKQVS